MLASSAQEKEKPFGTYPHSFARLAHAPLTMGNILFGDDSRSNHDRKDRSDKEATKAECPMVRSTIHRGFQSERSERGPKSVEETSPPGNDRGDNRSSRTEPVIDYNGLNFPDVFYPFTSSYDPYGPWKSVCTFWRNPETHTHRHTRLGSSQ